MYAQHQRIGKVFFASLLACFYSYGLVGCVNSSASNYLESINKTALGGGDLCSAPLRLPGPLQSKTPQYRFLKMMIDERVLEVRKTRSSTRTVDVVPGFKFATRKSRWLPGYREICYGSIRAVSIENINTSNPLTTVVRFRYVMTLRQWGVPLGQYLHIKSDGAATVEINTQSMRIFRNPDLNFRFAYFPLDGQNWYPFGIPGAIRHPVSI